MRVHLVSDVHGNADALSTAGDGSDALICLGDLLSFIDYHDLNGGLMGQLFGAERMRTWVELRTANQFEAARAYSRTLWESLPEGREQATDRVVREQYAKMFAAMPAPTYITYGNVDLPRLWAEYAHDGTRILDGQIVTLGGLTFGFVGGGLPSVMRTPHEVPEEEHAEKLAALGNVDVLCTHIPPEIPDLLYDTVARRFERGSPAILEVIRETQPRYAFFGHVHQPLHQRTRVGRTECVNVGHFRITETPYVLEW